VHDSKVAHLVAGRFDSGWEDGGSKMFRVHDNRAANDRIRAYLPAWIIQVHCRVEYW